MANSDKGRKPSLPSIHVEFVPRGSKVSNRAIDTYVDPDRSLKDAIASIVAETYPVEAGNGDSPFRNYIVYINRPRNTPFFPIAANEVQMKAFKRSLSHPRHRQILESVLASPFGIVVERHGISCFTVYEATPPS